MDPFFSDPLIMSFLVRGLTRQDLSTAEGQALVTRRLIELRAHIDLLLALQASTEAPLAESDGA